MKYLGTIENNKDLIPKEYADNPTMIGTTAAAGYYDFAEISFTGQNYYAKFIIEIETDNENLKGIYNVEYLGQRSSPAIINNTNKFISNNYPIYCLTNCYANASGVAANVPDLCGFKVDTILPSTQRNFKITLLEKSDNCNVILLSAIRPTIYTATNYNLAERNATSLYGYNYGVVSYAASSHTTSNYAFTSFLPGENVTIYNLLKRGIDNKYYALSNTTQEFDIYSEVICNSLATTANINNTSGYSLFALNFADYVQARYLYCLCTYVYSGKYK